MWRESDYKYTKEQYELKEKDDSTLERDEIIRRRDAAYTEQMRHDCSDCIRGEYESFGLWGDFVALHGRYYNHYATLLAAFNKADRERQFGKED